MPLAAFAAGLFGARANSMLMAAGSPWTCLDTQMQSVSVVVPEAIGVARDKESIHQPSHPFSLFLFLFLCILSSLALPL